MSTVLRCHGLGISSWHQLTAASDFFDATAGFFLPLATRSSGVCLCGIGCDRRRSDRSAGPSSDRYKRWIGSERLWRRSDHIGSASQHRRLHAPRQRTSTAGSRAARRCRHCQRSPPRRHRSRDDGALPSAHFVTQVRRIEASIGARLIDRAECEGRSHDRPLAGKTLVEQLRRAHARASVPEEAPSTTAISRLDRHALPIPPDCSRTRR